MAEIGHHPKCHARSRALERIRCAPRVAWRDTTVVLAVHDEHLQAIELLRADARELESAEEHDGIQKQLCARLQCDRERGARTLAESDHHDRSGDVGEVGSDAGDDTVGSSTKHACILRLVCTDAEPRIATSAACDRCTNADHPSVWEELACQGHEISFVGPEAVQSDDQRARLGVAGRFDDVRDEWLCGRDIRRTTGDPRTLWCHTGHRLPVGWR